MKIPDRWFKYINVNDFDFKSNDLIEVYLVDKEGRLFIEIGKTL